MVTDITTWPFLFIIYFMCTTYLNIHYLTYERLDILIHDSENYFISTILEHTPLNMLLNGMLCKKNTSIL